MPCGYNCIPLHAAGSMVAFICVPESWCPGFSWDSGSWSSTVCHASTRCGVECLHSAQGKVTVAGLFNRSHTLQQVGVPFAILCLWGVQDFGACKFMSILYNHFTSKVPIGLALLKAMIAILYIKSTGVSVCLSVRAVSRHCLNLCFFVFFVFFDGFCFLGRLSRWGKNSTVGEKFCSGGRILQLLVPLCCGCFCCCN